MDEVSLTARLSSALIRDNNDDRRKKIAYSVSSSSRNSRTFVRRSTRFPEWINDSLRINANASMLTRRMLPVSVHVGLGQTLTVEWHTYLNRWSLTIEQRCLKQVCVCRRSVMQLRRFPLSESEHLVYVEKGKRHS